MKIFALGVQLLALHGVAARSTRLVNQRGDAATAQNECDAGETIARELGPLLSKDAAIVLPSSADGKALLIRASSPRISPSYDAIVEVATESDVQETIRYANRHHTPFLAVSGAHGWPKSLNKVKHGIQINLRKLNHTRVNDDGQTANVGGGALQYEITAELFKKNKQAVTGICECTSGIGPLLGGGHSMLQQRHGFAADNLAGVRLVLANGTVVSVSEKQNADLFWAVRGAGHNFGVVTSYDLKLYDVRETWTMVAMSFTQDKLERFFNTWNLLEAKYEDPGMLLLNGVMARNDALDKAHAVINLQILFEGANSTAISDYIASFRALSPAADSTVENIAWGNLFDVGGFGLDSPVCRKNQNILGYPNSLPSWSPSSMRAGFTLFSELTADPVFATSAFMLESYGHKGVREVSESENAVAPEERKYQLLTSPILWWKGDDESNRKKAVEYGQKMQRAVRSKDVPAHSYVNYAAGGEPQPEVYGRDAKRIQKLKALKRAWDPQNRFGFYNPIH